MISDAELAAMLGRAVVASICTPTAMPSPTDDVNVLIGEVRRLRTALAGLFDEIEERWPDLGFDPYFRDFKAEQIAQIGEGTD